MKQFSEVKHKIIRQWYIFIKVTLFSFVLTNTYKYVKSLRITTWMAWEHQSKWLALVPNGTLNTRKII